MHKMMKLKKKYNAPKCKADSCVTSKSKADI